MRGIFSENLNHRNLPKRYANGENHTWRAEPGLSGTRCNRAFSQGKNACRCIWEPGIYHDRKECS
jgi:hypothetical protein